jgi:hypothetical protein
VVVASSSCVDNVLALGLCCLDRELFALEGSSNCRVEVVTRRGRDFVTLAPFEGKESRKIVARMSIERAGEDSDEHMRSKRW